MYTTPFTPLIFFPYYIRTYFYIIYLAVHTPAHTTYLSVLILRHGTYYNLVHLTSAQKIIHFGLKIQILATFLQEKYQFWRPSLAKTLV